MDTYIYHGESPIFTPKHGRVEPGQTVASDEVINHPDFEKLVTKEGADKAKK